MSVEDYANPSRSTFSSSLTTKGDYSKYFHRKHLYHRQIKLVRWIFSIMLFYFIFFWLSSQWQIWWKICCRQKALRMFLRSDQILCFSKMLCYSQNPLFETFTLCLHPLWGMLWITDAAIHRSKVFAFHVAGTNPLIALEIKSMAFSQHCNYCTGWEPWRWMIHGKIYRIWS